MSRGFSDRHIESSTISTLRLGRCTKYNLHTECFLAHVMGGGHKILAVALTLGTNFTNSCCIWENRGITIMVYKFGERVFRMYTHPRVRISVDQIRIRQYYGVVQLNGLHSHKIWVSKSLIKHGKNPDGKERTDSDNHWVLINNKETLLYKNWLQMVPLDYTHPHTHTRRETADWY